MKIYFVTDLDDLSGYKSIFKDHEIVNSHKEADIVVFTDGFGGVTPSLYGHKKVASYSTTYQRDLIARNIFKDLTPNQFAVGIGKGANQLCVFNHGKLIQALSGIFETTETVSVRSDDTIFQIPIKINQCPYPRNLDPMTYDILLEYQNEDNSIYSGYNLDYPGNFNIPVMIYFHNPELIRSLAIIGNIELMPSCSFVKYFNDLIVELYENQ